jgi:hypothetical protein
MPCPTVYYGQHTDRKIETETDRHTHTHTHTQTHTDKHPPTQTDRQTHIHTHAHTHSHTHTRIHTHTHTHTHTHVALTSCDLRKVREIPWWPCKLSRHPHPANGTHSDDPVPNTTLISLLLNQSPH